MCQRPIVPPEELQRSITRVVDSFKMTTAHKCSQYGKMARGKPVSKKKNIKIPICVGLAHKIPLRWLRFVVVKWQNVKKLRSYQLIIKLIYLNKNPDKILLLGQVLWPNRMRKGAESHLSNWKLGSSRWSSSAPKQASSHTKRPSVSPLHAAWLALC